MSPRTPIKTFGSILDGNRGIGAGFDTMRVGLSLSIVVFHSVGVSLGAAGDVYTWNAWPGPLCAALLPAFFSLSGFLVMGSAFRTPSLGGFIGLRALRIAPALATEITISALVLGPLLTTVPLQQYFTGHSFFEYFGSLVGRVRTALPGVFETNPDPGLVNVSLWTVRPELGCYVYLAILLLLGKVRDRRFVTIVTVAMVALNVAADLFAPLLADMTVAVLPDRLLLLSFVVGNFTYIFRHKVPYHPVLFVLGLAAAYLVTGRPALGTLAVVLLTYCTAWLGLTALPLIPFARRGDYSYGIYLYGYPVQQSVAYLFPALRTPLLNLALSLPVILLLAAVSWHVIELRALRLRRFLPKKQDAPAMARPTFLFLLLTLLFYGAYLNLTVLQLSHTMSVKVGSILAGGTVAFGAAAFAYSQLHKSEGRVGVVLRRALRLGRP